MKTKTAVLSAMICAGLLLGAASVSADTLITFQCDMSYQVQQGQFTNGTTPLYVRTYNATPAATWSNINNVGIPLTNAPGGDGNLYATTIDDTWDTNGAQIQYKFYIPGYTFTAASGYENTQTYNDNRVTLLPSGSGQQSVTLPVQFFGDQGPNCSSPQITVANPWFQVDMAQAIAKGTFNPATQTIQVNGSLGSSDLFGFGQGTTPSGNILTNDPTILRTNQFDIVTSNVYVGTLVGSGSIAGSPGATAMFKYVIQTPQGYEAPNNLNGDAQNSHNRFFFLTANPTNPIVFFGDQPYAPVATNTITFSVDMTDQNLLGLTSAQQVRLSGDFNNWDTTGVNTCTNNPNAANTNIYYATVTITNGYGAPTQFKFGYVNGNYEVNPTHTYPGNPSVGVVTPNREFFMPSVTGSNLALPTVYFNDTSSYSVLQAPPTTNFVTFSVSMTNAVGTDNHVFNPSVDSVYLNGVDVTNSLGNYSFDPWTNNPTGNPLGNFLMANNPLGSEIYTITVPIPAGYPVALSYQYSINGNQDEASGINHTRYIRSTGNYGLPLDVFGSMVQERSFGNLAVGPKSGGKVPITWLGRPGVHLQTKANLTAGAWTDLPGTDAQNATNYPVGAGASFFRLINPF